jgi:hypothetical protein
MAILARQFKDALTTIEPDDDVANAIVARDQVVAVLKADQKLKGWGVDPILIGSYKRHVSIKRIKDVDIFCRLPSIPDDIEGSDLLATFEEILEAAFPGNVKTQGRSVQVTFPDLDMFVDAVPARPQGDVWEIPCKEPSEGWERTNPEHLASLTTELNEILDEMYVPTVKLMRQARRSLIDDAKPRGLTAEVLAYWALESESAVDSIGELFVLALEGAADLLEEHLEGDVVKDPAMPAQELQMGASEAQIRTYATKLRTAATDARSALEDDDDCSAARVFRRILGKGHDAEYVFPLPDGCEGTGASRSSLAIRPGAERLPSRESPRFG